MKEIKVADLRKGGDIVNIEKQWDTLPIIKRAEIARAAGVAGRVSSSSWKNLHKMDKDAILKLYAPEAKPTVIEGPSPAATTLEDARLDRKIKLPKRVREGIEKVPTLSEEEMKFVDYREPYRETTIQDYLLWVGWGSYSTIKSFAAEANKMGVSRRISKIPRDLVLGKSRIFLAHDEGETGDAVIFGYFIPTGIEMIVFDSSTINGLGLRKDITPVTLEQAGAEDERGCGSRLDVGSVYLVSYVSEDTMRQIANLDIEKDAQLRGAIIMLRPPKDYNYLIDVEGRRFRGIKKVDGQRILSGRPKKEPSLRHKIEKSQKMPRKRGDKWSEEEIELLRKLTSEMRPRRAFREMMKITGRSLPTMEWHYRRIRESK